MKLAKEFITQNYKNEQLMVATGASAKSFHGLVRSNSTAAFIIEKLKGETTIDELVTAMTDAYEVDEDRARRDIEAVIGKLRSIGAIDA